VREGATLASVNADEIAQSCAAAMYAGDSASRRLGIEISEVAPGRATASMAITDDMVNGHGICHGGYVFTLADTAFAFACNTYNERTVAAGAGIDFLEPVQTGARLTAAAVERTRRGRSGVYDVTVSTTSGLVVAEFRGRSRTIGGPLLGSDGANGG
jgi:acyl-CoA thioesterase